VRDNTPHPNDVMAAALIDRLVHHCHLVTIRGNSDRMRQHSELWQTLHTALVRRPRRPEARPLVDLSDFHPTELSDFGPAVDTWIGQSAVQQCGKSTQRRRNVELVPKSPDCPKRDSVPDNCI
jgi:hypothetical protein